MYSIIYYVKNRLYCEKVFDTKAEFDEWKSFEMKVGNSLQAISENYCKCKIKY